MRITTSGQVRSVRRQQDDPFVEVTLAIPGNLAERLQLGQGVRMQWDAYATRPPMEDDD